MSIPANAKVRAAPSFLACLRAAEAFMHEQDAASAPERFKRLQAEVIKARTLLAFSPASGRPARFTGTKSAWGQFQAQQATQLAREVGMPELGELVLARHVLLYAHSACDVLLLSLRHERQMGYRLAV